MQLKHPRRLLEIVIVVSVTLASALTAYGILVGVFGVTQPLMIVASRSMEPAIEVGDVIAVHAVSPPQVQLGDVIIYERTGSDFRIIHRVICIVTSGGSKCVPSLYVYLECSSPPCYYTKGDNEPGPDPWVVASSEILGRWTGIRVPYFGMAFTCLRQDPNCPYPWGLASLVALSSAVASDFAFEYLLSKREAKKRTLKHVSAETIGLRT